jgi:hypothetical protein
MALVAPAEVGTMFPGLTPSDESQLMQVIDLADALLATWLGWPTPVGGVPTLQRSTYTEYTEHLHCLPRQVGLQCPAVVSVSEVAIDASTDFDGAEVLVADTDRITRGRRVLLKRTASPSSFPDEPESVRVTYLGGFGPREDEAAQGEDFAPVPAHIRAAMLLCIREIWRLKSIPGLPNGLDIAPEPGAVITPEIKALLTRHRVVHVG